MDGDRFDKITRSLASGASRRRVLKGIAGGIAAGFAAVVGRRDQAEAQTTQPQCGNIRCASNPAACPNGCVCCTYSNGNSRCLPAANCSGTPTCGAGEVYDPTLGCLPSGTGGPCGSQGDCPSGFVCVFISGSFGVCSPTSPTGMAFTAPPETVWHALTDADTLASLGITSNIAPRAGHRFQFRAAGTEGDGTIEAEMISVDAPRQFAFKWLNGPLDEPTTVTVTLDPEEGGTVTRLRLAHTDPTGASCRAGALVLGRNWGQRLVTDALPRYLDQRRME